MIEVTKEQFFATVGQMDVLPSSERAHTSWETRSRQVVGRTTPGYMCRDEQGRYTDEAHYYVADQYAVVKESLTAQ